jgi:dTMP kinase
VISDRFMDSTRAYQGAAGVSPELLDRLEQRAIGGDRPDLTLILDLPPELGMLRIGSRDRPVDRFEADSMRLHEARRRIFLDIAAGEPGRCVVIDARADEAAVAAAIRGVVAERLDPAAAARA